MGPRLSLRPISAPLRADQSEGSVRRADRWQGSGGGANAAQAQYFRWGRRHLGGPRPPPPPPPTLPPPERAPVRLEGRSDVTERAVTSPGGAGLGIGAEKRREKGEKWEFGGSGVARMRGGSGGEGSGVKGRGQEGGGAWPRGGAWLGNGAGLRGSRRGLIGRGDVTRGRG